MRLNTKQTEKQQQNRKEPRGSVHNSTLSRLDRGLKLSWLIIGFVSLVFFVVQCIRGISFSFSMVFMGGIGLFMVGLYLLGMRNQEITGRLYKTKVFRVLKLGYTLFLALFLVIGILILVTPLRESTEKTDYLIILGAKVNDNGVSLSLMNRLDRALSYLSVYPDTTVILCGGQGSDEPMTEALAMERYIQASSVNTAATLMIREEESSNTIENLKNAAEIITAQERNRQGEDGEHGERGEDDEHSENSTQLSPDVRVLVVTSDFHVLRAKMLAGRVGLNASALSAGTPFYLYPGSFVREIFAVFKSFLLDH